ncbi:MAG: protein kinase [Gemmataceae bacterium]
MKTLLLQPIAETQAVQTGTVLIEALELKKLNVLKSCGGQGLCATCHVHVRKGMESLSPLNEREKRTLSFISGTDSCSRLACQARVFDNGVVVEVPKGMYIERAEDLLDLLGTRAPEDILHPIKGIVLIAKGKIITRTQIEELKNLQNEVSAARANTGSTPPGVAPEKPTDRPANRPVPPPNQPPKSQPAVPRPPLSPAPPFAPTASRGSLSSGHSSGMVPPVNRPSQMAREVPRPNLPNPPSVRSTLSAATASASTGFDGLGSSRLPGPLSSVAGSSGPQIGDQLGKCLLQSRLGTGSTGNVFRAHHRTLGIPVAVKVIKIPTEASPAEQEAIRVRLRAEAQLLAQINHPNIVRVWDFDDEHEFPYVVLELIDGPSLAELIQQCGRITPERALSIAAQVAEALQAAWQLGVVHRDVKPGNILITREGKAKLADLGLARSQQDGKSTAGTIAYMPPEQANSGEIDLRSDIYALGATLYHAITGRLPFPGKTLQEVLFKHANQPLDPPETLVPGIWPSLSQLIQDMMAKSPADRPQSYPELIAEIHQAAPPAPPTSKAPPSTRLVPSLGHAI